MTDWDETVRKVQFREKRTFDAGRTPGMDAPDPPSFQPVRASILDELTAGGTATTGDDDPSFETAAEAPSDEPDADDESAATADTSSRSAASTAAASDSSAAASEDAAASEPAGGSGSQSRPSPGRAANSADNALVEASHLIVFVAEASGRQLASGASTVADRLPPLLAAAGGRLRSALLAGKRRVNARLDPKQQGLVLLIMLLLVAVLGAFVVG
ncbi:hypothetical protein VB779_16065 [Haloarculaceae archaeon H-GB11]|nr:hypothetical protein [Haloarculaceae archaeon H-GB11]